MFRKCSQEEKLERSIDRINEFKYVTAEGLLLLDPGGQILFANRPAGEMLGVSERKIVGRPCYEICRWRDPDGSLVCFQGCAVMALEKRDGPVQNFNVQTTNRSGGDLWLNVTTLIKSNRSSRKGGQIIHILRPTISLVKRADLTLQIPSSFDEPINKVKRPFKPREQPGAHSHLQLMKRFSLTQREAEVLRFITQGRVAKEIAAALGLGTTTVRTHIQKILKKMGVHSKLEAVAKVFRQNDL